MSHMAKKMTSRQPPYFIFPGTLEYEVGLFCFISLLSIEEVKSVWMHILPVPSFPWWAETLTYEAWARLTTKLIDLNEQNMHDNPSGILPRRSACQNYSSGKKKKQQCFRSIFIYCYLGRISRRNADNKTHTDIFGIFVAAWRWLAGQP